VKVDLDFDFVVGREETHTVSFHWRQFWGVADVEVDGTSVYHERHPFGMKVTRRYEFSVGRLEVHSVLIEKTRPLVAGGIRKQAVKVFVDQELVGEY
jgi:hypothetical protein